MNRYIPENAEAITRPNVPAVAYVYFNKLGKPVVIAYEGKKSKPSFHYSFTTKEECALKIVEFLARMEAITKEKAALKAAKAAYQHNYKIGDILDASWGYEQTNVNFYEVIALKGKKSVVVRELSQTNCEDTEYSMAGKSVPTPGHYIGGEFSKRVTEGGWIKVNTSVRASEWNGKPKYYSTYA